MPTHFENRLAKYGTSTRRSGYSTNLMGGNPKVHAPRVVSGGGGGGGARMRFVEEPNDSYVDRFVSRVDREWNRKFANAHRASKVSDDVRVSDYLEGKSRSSEMSVCEYLALKKAGKL